MRVRALTADGDYAFGQSQANFLVDSAAMVAQSIRTRLLLMRGEWFLDKNDGTPYAEAILGAHKKALYDLVIQERILRTPGVTVIDTYSSNLDAQNRALTVQTRVSTAFGPVTTVGAF